MPRPLLLTPLLLALAVLLPACGAQGDDDDAAPPPGMVLVETELGTIARPDEWRPVADAETADRVAGFEIVDGDEVVGQMDVFVNAFSPGTEADTVDAAVQGQRMMHFRDLEHTRREFVEVPGADSAFLTESTYSHAETGEQVRSIDQVAVTEDGDSLLVRISALADDYDADGFGEVVATMTLS